MKIPPFFCLTVFLTICFASCGLEDTDVKPECEDGWGKLRLENTSLNTVQRILIGGTNYGTLDPGESETYELPVGDYTVTMEGISGGGGCGAPSEVHIPDCGTVGRNCSH